MARYAYVKKGSDINKIISLLKEGKELDICDDMWSYTFSWQKNVGFSVYTERNDSDIHGKSSYVFKNEKEAREEIFWHLNWHHCEGYFLLNLTPRFPHPQEEPSITL